MTDWFALFEIPARPWLDEADLKARYLRLAALHHPDSTGGNEDTFRALQEAHRGLLDPAVRLRHLLSRQFPDAPAEKNAMPLTELFMQVGPALQQAKASNERAERATSHISRTMASLEVSEALRKLRQIGGQVKEAQEALRARLRELDAAWPELDPRHLAQWASEWTFLAKWHGELAEWEFRLANAWPIPKLGTT